MMDCMIFRVPGERPDMTSFAVGAKARGYRVEFKDPTRFSEERAEGWEVPSLVVICGGLYRFKKQNDRIWRYYVSCTDVVIVEPWRDHPSAQLMTIGAKPWIPPVITSFTRREQFGLRARFLDKRGNDIVFIGQRRELDCQMEHFTAALARDTGRVVLYRPHPNMWRLPGQGDYNFPIAHDISDPGDNLGPEQQESLERDLARAWCVVTHSSIVSLAAVMLGIPTHTHPQADVHDFSRSWYPSVPTSGAVDNFLNRFSHKIWTWEEIESGACLDFLVGMMR